MKTFRPPFPIPILRIDDFLLEADAQRIFDKCLDLKTAYTPGRVFDGPATTKVDLKYRRNDAVYFQDELSEVRDILKKKIWTAECREVWHEGYYIFDVINYAT
jgi:hypothetical protein